MNILITLGHPAHFHLFRNLALRLQDNGHIVKFVLTEKDILIKLVKEYNFDYEILAYRKKAESFFDKLSKISKSTRMLNAIVKRNHTDLMIGCLSQMAWIGFIRKIPTIFFGEDDFNYTWMQGIITYPFVSTILAPAMTKVGPFKWKKISYNGYQKLAYLHPNEFVPDKKKLIGIDLSKPFYVIRLVSLSAHHDINIGGLNYNLLHKIIDALKNRGTVYVSSEEELPFDFNQYGLPGNINIKDIHHILYYSTLFLGDSQSMAVEAAMLGVPNIRYNDFAGKISILNELENVYKLTSSINTQFPNQLLDLVDKITANEHIRKQYSVNRHKMLAEKIDVTAFYVWFIENYPESKSIMKENPDYQYGFR